MPKDTDEIGDKLLHIGQLVKDDTSAKLKQARETNQSANVGTSNKIAYAELAKDFQAILKEFQKAHQRLATEREMAYTLHRASAMDVSLDKTAEQHGLLVDLEDNSGSHIEIAQLLQRHRPQGKSQLANAAKTQRSSSTLAGLLLSTFGIELLIVIIVLAVTKKL